MDSGSEHQPPWPSDTPGLELPDTSWDDQLWFDHPLQPYGFQGDQTLQGYGGQPQFDGPSVNVYKGMENQMVDFSLPHLHPPPLNPLYTSQDMNHEHQKSTNGLTVPNHGRESSSTPQLSPSSPGNISRKRETGGPPSPRSLKRQRTDSLTERGNAESSRLRRTPQPTIPGLSSSAMVKVLMYVAQKFDKPPRQDATVLPDGRIVCVQSFEDLQEYLDRRERLDSPEREAVAPQYAPEADVLGERGRRSLAERYGDYQPTRKKTPSPSPQQGRYRCISGHGCNWSHENKPTWQHHERHHYPSSIWICPYPLCHQQDEHKWVFLRKDLLTRHFETRHPKVAPPVDADEHCITVISSKFPKSCVFRGCCKTFTTMKERLAHSGRHLESNHDLDPKKLKDISGQTEDDDTASEEEDEHDDGNGTGSEWGGFDDGAGPDSDAEDGEPSSENGPQSRGNDQSSHGSRPGSNSQSSGSTGSGSQPSGNSHTSYALKPTSKSRVTESTKNLLVRRTQGQLSLDVMRILSSIHLKSEDVDRISRSLYASHAKKTRDLLDLLSGLSELQFDISDLSSATAHRLEGQTSWNSFAYFIISKSLRSRFSTSDFRLWFSVGSSAYTKIHFDYTSSESFPAHLWINHSTDLVFETRSFSSHKEDRDSKVKPVLGKRKYSSSFDSGIFRLKERRLTKSPLSYEHECSEQHKIRSVMDDDDSSTDPYTKKATPAWTLQEDLKLWQLRERKVSWSSIAKRFGGKTANACRKRHQRLMSHPGKFHSKAVEAAFQTPDDNIPQVAQLPSLASLHLGELVDACASPPNGHNSLYASPLSTRSDDSSSSVSSLASYYSLKPQEIAADPSTWSQSMHEQQMMPGYLADEDPTSRAAWSSSNHYASTLYQNRYVPETADAQVMRSAMQKTRQRDLWGPFQQCMAEQLVLPLVSGQSGSDGSGLMFGF